MDPPFFSHGGFGATRLDPPYDGTHTNPWPDGPGPRPPRDSPSFPRRRECIRHFPTWPACKFGGRLFHIRSIDLRLHGNDKICEVGRDQVFITKILKVFQQRSSLSSSYRTTCRTCEQSCVLDDGPGVTRVLSRASSPNDVRLGYWLSRTMFQQNQ